MKWKSFLTIAVSFLMLRVPAFADGKKTLAPQDFASGAQIDAIGPDPLFKFPLNEAVYKGLLYPDLRDIRIFNAASESVPYELSRQRNETREERITSALRLFPIQESTISHERGSRIEVQESPSGEIVTVRYSGKAPGKTEVGVTSYLIDLRKAVQAISALEFEWSASSTSSLVPTTIEASDDLRDWRTVVSAVPLVKLSYAGQSLDQKRIDIPRTRSAYLRISFPRGGVDKLLSVRGESSSSEIRSIEKQWLAVEGKPSDKEPGEFFFDLGGPFPIDTVKVELPAKNSFVACTLLSRQSEKAEWTDKASMTAYRVTLGGEEVLSPARGIATSPDRYWKLKVSGKEAQIRGGAPVLRLGWVPHEITFLASGNPPYTIAFGNAQADRPDFGFGSIREIVPSAFGGKTTIAGASLGQVSELGGSERLTVPVVVKPIDWKTIGLWSVLSLIILVVGGMAYGLFKEMSAKR